MKIISSKNAPEAIGPYSQAIQLERFLFVSGQIPVNAKTGTAVENNIEAQAHQAMKNVKAILQEAGYELQDVVKTTCFLKNMEDFAAFNQIYAEYFTHCPARSCVAVREIPKGVLCEIEVIAYK